MGDVETPKSQIPWTRVKTPTTFPTSCMAHTCMFKYLGFWIGLLTPQASIEVSCLKNWGPPKSGKWVEILRCLIWGLTQNSCARCCSNPCQNLDILMRQRWTRGGCALTCAFKRGGRKVWKQLKNSSNDKQIYRKWTIDLGKLSQIALCHQPFELFLK